MSQDATLHQRQVDRSLSNINLSTKPYRIIKTGNCPTLSDSSTLSYHISHNGNGNGKSPAPNLSFRISANDGGGYFSSERVSFGDIQQALVDCSEPQIITSMALRGLFKGKSVNTSAFLVAALKSEGLLEQVANNKRHHQLNDSKPFMAEMKKLIAVKTDLKVEAPKEMIQRSHKK